MKVEKYNNIESVELALFKELNISEDIIFPEVVCSGEKKIDSIFRYSTLLKVVKIDEEGTIAQTTNGYYYTFETIQDISEGDFVLLIGSDKIIKIDLKVFDYLNNLTDDNEVWLRLSSDEFDFDILTIEVIKKLQEDKKKQEEEKEKEREAEKLEEEKADREREVKMKELEEKYNQTSIYDEDDIKIDKNIIDYSNSYFILDRDVNKVFMLSELKYIRHFCDIETKLIGLEEPYTKKEDNLITRIEFNPCRVNGVKVIKARLPFILRRITSDITPEKIALLSQLTGMKVELLELKNIDISDIKIPISVKVVNKDTFNLDFLGVENNISWELANKLFFYGNTRRLKGSIAIHEATEYAKTIGLTKQDVYNYLKKASMLNNC